MAQKLENHINAHPELNGVCRAGAPKRPNPRILIYDVPDLPDDRGEQEALFLTKLGVSNSFPEGAATVLFSRKGRGSSQNWVLSLDPVAYHSIRTSNRIHWGFGSFRFRTFSEPQQCYKCFKFGHTRSGCRVPNDLCSRCPGEHSHKTCKEQPPVCLNCKEFNRRNRAGPLLRVHHTAVSRSRPIFLRECDEFQGRFNTVFKKNVCVCSSVFRPVLIYLFVAVYVNSCFTGLVIHFCGWWTL
ncbi:hypothetical protein AVEN_55983-1 [Araneus ventricosus]|uniref:CCHC-type domain-containing protein n=1 Tax=Araneus ventricosus TaxID=182803 RepID=A0A4Y2PE64_ARAVE|nr:hypothetical protein AVEN_55983-1 [Araneus ventricosus]